MSLCEIPRSATLAWCPERAYSSCLALGGRGDSAQLEFVSLDRNSLDSYKVDFSVDLEGDPLRCLSWTDHRSLTPQSSYSQQDGGAGAVLGSGAGRGQLGILYGGTGNGKINVWDPALLLQDAERRGSTTIRGQTEGLICQVKPCEFDASISCLGGNPIRKNLVACGTTEGTVHIMNLERPSDPDIYEPVNDFHKGTRQSGSNEVTSLAWNSTVAHVLATSSISSGTTIFDLKTRKTLTRFRDPAGRQRPSSVAWVPDETTQVVVAYDDDMNPSLQMWDLRNPTYPFKDLAGIHSRGIVDVQFCPNDANLMLTCGKDFRTACLVFSEAMSSSAPTARVFSEATTTDWQCEVRWSPHMPGVYASSSHIQGVGVWSAQQAVNPATRYTPKWFKRPSGVTAGFGGKLISFGQRSGTVIRTDIVPSTEPEIIRESDEFERVLMSESFVEYCERRIAEAHDDSHEKMTWGVIQSLLLPDRKTSLLVEKLGFNAQAIEQAVEQFLGRRPGALLASALPVTDQNTNNQLADNPYGNSEAEQLHLQQQQQRASGGGVGLYDGTSGQSAEGGGSSFFAKEVVDPEKFFRELGERNEQQERADESSSNIDTQALGDALAVPKSQESDRDEDTKNWNRGPDLLIKRSLMIGQTPTAVEVCIESGRWSEALLLAATSRDGVLWERTKRLFLKEKAQDRFLQMIGCVVSDEWGDVVNVADPSQWGDALALLATYSPEDKFPALAQELGLRLEREKFDIRSAVVCYIAAGSFQRAAQVWSSLTVSSNRGRSLQDGLQDLVEKLVVLRRATNFNEENELFTQKVSQYAEILANSGRLVAAMKFLCLVGASGGSRLEQPDCSSAILRDRIYNSSPEAMRQAGVARPTSLPFVPVNIMPLPAPAPPVLQQQQRQQQSLASPGGPPPPMPQNRMSAMPPQPTSGYPPVPGAYGQPAGPPHPSLSRGQQPPMRGSNAPGGYPPTHMNVSNGMIPSSMAPAHTNMMGQQHQVQDRAMSSMPPPLSHHSSHSLPHPHHHHQQQQPPMMQHPPPPLPSTTSGPPAPSSIPSQQQHTSTTAATPYPPPLQRSGMSMMSSPPPPPTTTAAINSHQMGSSYHPTSAPALGTYAATPPMAPQRPPLPSMSLPTPQMPAYPSGAPHPSIGGNNPITPNMGISNMPSGGMYGGSGLMHQQQQQPGSTPSGLPGQLQQQRSVGSQGGPTPMMDGSAGHHHQYGAPHNNPAAITANTPFANSQQGALMSSTNTGVAPPRGVAVPSPPSATSSTAPAAGAAHLPSGMPVPWPIPTDIQHVGYSTSTTAPANQKIHEIINKPATGAPMNPNDFAFVQRVLNMAVEAQAANEPNQPRKHQDQRAKVQDLYNQLSNGMVSKASQDLLLNFCRAVEAGDLATATQIQVRMATTCWTNESKLWLMGLKRLLTK